MFLCFCLDHLSIEETKSWILQLLLSETILKDICHQDKKQWQTHVYLHTFYLDMKIIS